MESSVQDGKRPRVERERRWQSAFETVLCGESKVGVDHWGGCFRCGTGRSGERKKLPVYSDRRQISGVELVLCG